MTPETANNEIIEATEQEPAIVLGESKPPEKQQPLYQSVLANLIEKIEAGDLKGGAVIKEGPLSSVFDVSRAPVRRALQMLADSGRIRPADGQGYVVGKGPETGPLNTSELERIFLDRAEMDRAPTWENIYDGIKLDVTNCLPFGTFRISETLACNHFSVGRTALREALGKLRDSGFLEKSSRSHWLAGPLTARDIHEAFEIRQLLEPEALRQSARHFGKDALQEMCTNVDVALNNLDAATPEQVESIENELHRTLLGKCKNTRLLDTIEQNQFPFIVIRIFRRNFGLRPDLRSLEDHAQILQQLSKNQTDVACSMLQAHLENARINTLAKLRVLSILPKPETAPYLINVH